MVPRFSGIVRREPPSFCCMFPFRPPDTEGFTRPRFCQMEHFVFCSENMNKWFFVGCYIFILFLLLQVA